MCDRARQPLLEPTVIHSHEFSAAVVAGNRTLQFRMIDFSDHNTGFMKGRTLLGRFVNDVHFHVFIVGDEPTERFSSP